MSLPESAEFFTTAPHCIRNCCLVWPSAWGGHSTSGPGPAACLNCLLRSVSARPPGAAAPIASCCTCQTAAAQQPHISIILRDPSGHVRLVRKINMERQQAWCIILRTLILWSTSAIPFSSSNEQTFSTLQYQAHQRHAGTGPTSFTTFNAMTLVEIDSLVSISLLPEFWAANCVFKQPEFLHVFNDRVPTHEGQQLQCSRVNCNMIPVCCCGTSYLQSQRFSLSSLAFKVKFVTRH